MSKNKNKITIASKRTLLISGFILAIVVLTSGSAFAYQVYVENNYSNYVK